jgi:hypothetical protein
LIICDGVSQLSNESGQSFGVINVPEEPNQRMLFGKRFKLGHDNFQFPEGGEIMDIYSHECVPSKLRSPCFLCMVILTCRGGKYLKERVHPMHYTVHSLGVVGCSLEQDAGESRGS